MQYLKSLPLRLLYLFFTLLGTVKIVIQNLLIMPFIIVFCSQKYLNLLTSHLKRSQDYLDANKEVKPISFYEVDMRGERKCMKK